MTSSPPPADDPSSELGSEAGGRAMGDILGGDATLAGDATLGPSATGRARPLGRGDQVGRYLLVDPLGRGAMGQVFRAYDPDLDRQLAIKILFRTHTSDRARLLDEAKAMARIDHAHVITVHDAGVHEDTVFIAMEIVDGPSLDRWLKTPRDPHKVLDVLIGAARGLAAAHAAGVIHRDFKPANVLVTPDGRAKVGDFGLAGLEDETTVATGEGPEHGGALGTPGYMSPEHIAGVGIDGRSDQFSFAVTLYEALRGQRPFAATTWPALAAQVLAGEVVPELSGRIRGVDGIIRRALSVAPDDRYPSMDALVTALERIRRRWWPYGLALGALAVGIVGTSLAPRPQVEGCVPGHQRVEAWWNDSAKASLRLKGEEYTERFLRRGRDRFATALDDYAADWADAYDEVCEAMGPRSDEGTAAQQNRAQCLGSRLESLRGLVELATTTTLDAGRIDGLVGTLPGMEDCTQDHWVPYPADPERAARASAIHRTLGRIQQARFADDGEDLELRAADAVAEARALGEPYLLAWAIAEHARTLESRDESSAAFGEALEVAIRGGYDLLAADTINELILTRGKQTGWAEVVQLAAMARGLVERGGGNEQLLGNLTNNEANALRRAARFEEARARFEQAEAHYRAAGDMGGVALARLNRAIVMFEQDRIEEALPVLRETTEELERLDAASPRAVQGQLVLTVSLLRAGRSQEAYEYASQLYRFVSNNYAPGAESRKSVTRVLAFTALNVGEAQAFDQSLEAMRSLPDPTVSERFEIQYLTSQQAELTARFDRCLELLDDIEREFSREMDDEMRMSVALSRGHCQYLSGRRADVHALLTAPWLSSILASADSPPHFRSAFAMLGALSGAPPPPGCSWHSIAPAKGKTGGSAVAWWSSQVAEAVGTMDDPRPTILGLREELVTAYHAGDVNVRMLDLWLEEHGGR